MIDCEAGRAMGSQPAVPGKWCLGQINLATESRLSGGGRNRGSSTTEEAVRRRDLGRS